MKGGTARCDASQPFAASFATEVFFYPCADGAFKPSSSVFSPFFEIVPLRRSGSGWPPFRSAAFSSYSSVRLQCGPAARKAAAARQENRPREREREKVENGGGGGGGGGGWGWGECGTDAAEKERGGREERGAMRRG